MTDQITNYAKLLQLNTQPNSNGALSGNIVCANRIAKEITLSVVPKDPLAYMKDMAPIIDKSCQNSAAVVPDAFPDIARAFLVQDRITWLNDGVAEQRNFFVVECKNGEKFEGPLQAATKDSVSPFDLLGPSIAAINGYCSALAKSKNSNSL